MKNILTTALLPLLAGLAMSCSSSIALRSTENDDLYYASTDKTIYPGQSADAYSGNTVNPDAGEVANPEYAGGSTAPSVINNYNYYDNDRYYSRGYSSRFRNYNYYGYDPFYDPFYSPFGYSAAYCYNMYDPFWYPYCYPAGGLSISVGFGWGYPAYGGFYGHRPYGFYGYPYGGYPYGYGGYYQGFYEGYYAGGGGYGYGYNRNRVHYGPRTNRSSVPVNAGRDGAVGRPASPGRVAQPNNNNVGGLIPGSRPHRVAQPGTAPGKAVQPGNTGAPQNGREAQQQAGRPTQNIRPGREAQVQPENYQFQQTAPQNQQVDYNRPVRDNATVPNMPGRTPGQDVRPSVQPEVPVQQAQPSRREQRRAQQQQRYQQPAQQPSTPVYENSRPSRSNNSGSFQSSPSRSSSPSYSPPGGGGGGRPRR